MFRIIIVAAVSSLMSIPAFGSEESCVDCHRKITPGIVREWELSRHSENNIGCAVCHSGEHISAPLSASDPAKTGIPLPEKCGECHGARLEQFTKGKHSKAWRSMEAMPTAHWQPMALMEGMKGCGGCHKIGVKSEEEIRKLRESGSYGLASCDACHTRHQFSVKEAQDPQSCRTCHMGIDHPQWEMYSSSKHGVRHQLKQDGTLPDSTAAPTCQFCHMPSGDHGVRTAWGFPAVRLPMPLDKEWASDRTLILKALGILDPQGKPGARFKAVADLDLARLTQEDWERERARMITACTQCHSRRFAEGELAKADSLIRESDRLMAEGIAIVADLYTSLVMEKPEWYAYGYADVLTFHDAPTVVEQKLFRMFMEHRMRTFQGAFHMNPDYSLWYGWSEMKQDLTEIKELARAMKAGKGK
jgi:hypothetical protein